MVWCRVLRLAGHHNEPRGWTERYSLQSDLHTDIHPALSSLLLLPWRDRRPHCPLSSIRNLFGSSLGGASDGCGRLEVWKQHSDWCTQFSGTVALTNGIPEWWCKLVVFLSRKSGKAKLIPKKQWIYSQSITSLGLWLFRIEEMDRALILTSSWNYQIC